MRSFLFATFVLAALATASFAQRPQQRPLQQVPPQEFLTNQPANVPTSSAGDEYRIGRDDLIEITVFEVPDLGASGRVSASGIVSLPLTGTVMAAGKTPQELEHDIEELLKKNYINDPHVTVFVREYASQPVSILGAVRLPGMYQLKGQKTLMEMLSMAQGLDQNAGKTIQVLRRSDNPDEPSQTITVGTEDLFQYGKTELNIPIKAGDVIHVQQAGSIFVIGEVMRPGEFVLRQGKDVTATQAVALGGGSQREAKRKECLIIRLHRDGSKDEIPVNLEKIGDGTLVDVPLMPNDILFVPSNRVKTGMMRVLDTTIATLSARLIYRF
jgi:polysaccharide export outer membrane protein